MLDTSGESHPLLESARHRYGGTSVQAILAIIGGAAIGGWLGQGFGALAGAAIVWLVQRSSQQASRLAALQNAVDALSARAGASPLAPATPPTTPAITAAPPPRPEVAPEPADARPADAVPASEAPAGTDSLWRDEPQDTEVGSLWGDVASEPRTPKPPRSAPAAAVPPDLLAPIRQWLFGGNTIVKLGVGILFIGLAFLAKFATEHVHVPIEVRLAGIGAAALALLGLGWRLRNLRAGYAQVLQGGAVAVLYLTLFVAFRFYGVLAVGPVFVCMVAVAALAAALAVLQDARALAVIGALGGFATPLLISTGSGNHVALFSYYLVLDLGIAFVAWHKNWRLLNLIGFFATFLVGTAWGVLKYNDANYASSQAFLIIYFLLFTAILLMPARQVAAESGGDSQAATPPRSDAWVNGSLLFGLPTITFVLQHGLVRHTEYGTALSALVLALFYVGAAAWMRSRPRLATAFEASLAIGTVFLTLVIPFALDAHSTAGAWALEGAGLVWLGWRQQRLAARGFGYLLLLLAGAAMLHAREFHGSPSVFFNAMLFNGLMAAAASLMAAYFVQRGVRAAEGTSRPGEALAEPLLIGWATLWLLAVAATQIGNFVDARFGISAWLVCLSAIASAYVLLAVRLNWPRVALPALAHAPLLALGVAASAALQHAPLQDGGWWAWPLAIGVHLLILGRASSSWPAPAAQGVHALGVLVLAALGALQGRAITADWGDPGSAWRWLGWLVVPAALLMWLPRAATATRWPVRAAPVVYQTGAAAVLAAGLLLWTLLANAASNGSARPLAHLPLLNPLDVGVGIALLAAGLWARSPAAQPLLAAQPALPIGALGLAVFAWLNAILMRAFHHYGDVPYRLQAWLDSLAVQTGITLLWSSTALALMWFSARRAARLPWLVGAVLLGAVVLKLLLVDLSGSGTVTRIVSFIGVGVLMLVIGYVAPLPSPAATTGRPEVPRANV